MTSSKWRSCSPNRSGPALNTGKAARPLGDCWRPDRIHPAAKYESAILGEVRAASEIGGRVSESSLEQSLTPRLRFRLEGRRFNS